MQIDLMTPKQVAEYFRISEGTLQSWRSLGRYDLPFIKVGRKVMYRRQDVESFVERNTVGRHITEDGGGNMPPVVGITVFDGQ